MSNVESYQTPDSKLEIKKQLFIGMAEKVIGGEIVFADAAIKELQTLDPDGKDEQIQELLTQLPAAEIINLIDTARRFFEQGDNENTLSWLGEARDSLAEREALGQLAPDIKEKLDGGWMELYNEIQQSLHQDLFES